MSKNAEDSFEMSWTLRIMGSQNWWFGDPRTLLYRVKPLYRRVQWFLGKEGSSSFRMLRRNTSWCFFFSNFAELWANLQFFWDGWFFACFRGRIEGWNDTTQRVPSPKNRSWNLEDSHREKSGGSHSELGSGIFFNDERIIITSKIGDRN